MVNAFGLSRTKDLKREDDQDVIRVTTFDVLNAETQKGSESVEEVCR